MKKQVLLSKIIMMLGGAIAGGTVGFYALSMTDKGFFSNAEMVLSMVTLVAIALVAFWIQLIAHEGGHMIFGLLSGYEFVSFRIGSHIFIKQNGVVNHKRFSLAGTGGQCLMAPPPYKDGSYPYVLYHLGGIMMNVIIAALFLIIKIAFKPGGFLGIFCVMMVAMGVALAIMNGIPYKTDMVSNDGYNALNMGKDKDGMKGVWTMLEVNKLQAEGNRIKDMDASMFEIRDGADMKNPLVSGALVLNENRLMDCHDFDGASEVIDRLLSEECGGVGLSTNLIKLDKIYIDIFRNGKAADLSALDEKQMKNFIKAMTNYPAVVRTLYGVSIIKEEEAEQKKLLERMDKLKGNYPYPGDLESEFELMELVRK